MSIPPCLFLSLSLSLSLFVSPSRILPLAHSLSLSLSLSFSLSPFHKQRRTHTHYCTRLTVWRRSVRYCSAEALFEKGSEYRYRLHMGRLMETDVCACLFNSTLAANCISRQRTAVLGVTGAVCVGAPLRDTGLYLCFLILSPSLVLLCCSFLFPLFCWLSLPSLLYSL